MPKKILENRTVGIAFHCLECGGWGALAQKQFISSVFLCKQVDSVLFCRAEDEGRQHLSLWSAPAPGTDPSALGPHLISAEPKSGLASERYLCVTGAK